MRERVVDLHLDHLGIDHDEAELIGREPVKHARDERVDADALAAAGRPGDEEMRHLREIGDDRFAVNIFAESDRQLRGGRVPIFRLQQLAQSHLHFAAVRQFDADGVLAGDGRENIDPFRACGTGEVAFQTNDLVHPHTFCGINFVAGDGRSLRDVAGRDCDPELAEGFDQNLLDVLQFGGIGRDSALRIVRIEQIDSGQLVIFAVPFLRRR